MNTSVPELSATRVIAKVKEENCARYCSRVQIDGIKKSFRGGAAARREKSEMTELSFTLDL